MPKLDGTHIAERLNERLERLRNGEEVAKREIEALLTDEQVAAMNAAWEAQQALRKQKRARTKEEEIALGWKTKREIQIEAYERAITEADDGMLETLEELQHKASVRQAKIYLDSYFKATKEGKIPDVARNLANNDLTRAGLKRVDGQVVGHQSKRDREVWEMEQQILGRIRSEMTPEELEQLELVEEHEKALREKGKKLGR
jgi:acyl-CoA thioesterase